MNTNIPKYYKFMLSDEVYIKVIKIYKELDDNQHILYEQPSGLYIPITLNYKLLSDITKLIGFELNDDDIPKLVKLGEHYCVDFVKVKTIKVA